MLEDTPHTVVAVGGRDVVLRHDQTGQRTAWLVSDLFTHPGLRLRDLPPTPVLTTADVLAGLPAAVAEEALRWEADLTNPDYASLTKLDAYAAIAAARTARGEPTSVMTVRRTAAGYRQHGLWGTVDGRSARVPRPFGRTDPRVLDAIAAVIAALEPGTAHWRHTASTRTKSYVIEQATRILRREFGTDVPLPSLAGWYRILDTWVATSVTDRRIFSSATTRRSEHSQPPGTWQTNHVMRPGNRVLFDTHTLDVKMLGRSGRAAEVVLVAAFDVATRTMAAAVLRPRGAKAVDAALLLAQCATPMWMRPDWSEHVAFTHALVGGPRLVDLDERLALAAAMPVIVPATAVVDHDKIYAESATFVRACEQLGVNVEWARPWTPPDKDFLERAFSTVKTRFSQYLDGYTGGSVAQRGDDVEAEARWTLEQLQDLFDEWLVADYQRRPHEGLRSVFGGEVDLSPNDVYVLATGHAGYHPMPFTTEQYLHLLPVMHRPIRQGGLEWKGRRYNDSKLRNYRYQPCPLPGAGRKWPIHYDPYDLSRVWLRDPGDDDHPEKFIAVPWVHRQLVRSPFTARMWADATRMAAERLFIGSPSEADVARVLRAELLDKLSGPPPQLVLPPTIALPAAPAPDEVATGEEHGGQPDVEPARTEPVGNHSDIETGHGTGRVVEPLPVAEPWIQEKKRRKPL